MFFEPGDLPDAELACDIAIIGAGAAGITLAQALDDGRRKIVLLEAGGLEAGPSDHALFRTQSLGYPVESVASRVRAFGGTTEQWTGRTAPLDPLDFIERPWVPDSGWPITFEEMSAPYREAMTTCGFRGDWEAPPAALAGTASLPAPPDSITPFVWRYWASSRQTFQHWGEAFYDRFLRSATIRVVLGATLVGLDGAGTVTAARLLGADGRTITVKARRYVLSCGGIENARLLLNVAADAPMLLGDVQSMIGRYFMQHPRAAVATVELSRSAARRMQSLFNHFRRQRGLMYETGLALSASEQERGRLLNASAVWRYTSSTAFDPRHPLVEGIRGARSMMNRLRGREPILGATRATLIADVEQQPDRDSSIAIVPERDATGLRRGVIDWRIDHAERRTAAAFTMAVCRWIEELGIGSPQPVPGIETDGGLRPELMLESFHHLGATRMSATPKTGVVDADLRVHGVENLYVCGGSVFPTGGHANPTLTIVALALRLARSLRIAP